MKALEQQINQIKNNLKNSSNIGNSEKVNYS